MWVGGRTARSLRRAVELGDAWVPFLLGPEQVHAMLEEAKRSPAWEAREHPLEVVLWPEPAVDPFTEADAIRREASLSHDVL